MLPHIYDWTNLLVIYYAAIFGYLIYRSDLFALKGISKRTVLALFGLKVGFALVYGYVNYYLIPGHDTFIYFQDGETIHGTLATEPWKYLRLTFGPNGTDLPAEWNILLRRIHNHWQLTSQYMVVRFNAICMLFSMGNYLVHSVFMAFVSFAGLALLYKSVVISTGRSDRWLMLAVFLIPSTLFWASGVHKDGLVLFFVGLLLWAFATIVHRQNRMALVWFLVAAAFIYMIRSYLILIMIPGLLSYLWVMRSPSLSWLKFIGVHLVYYVAVTQVPHMLPVGSLLQYLSDTQQILMLFEGGSDFDMQLLQPTLGSVTANLPSALANAFLRPYPGQVSSAVQLVSFLESWMVLVLIIACVWAGRPWRGVSAPATMYAFIGLSYMCLIGLVVPNLGAISRYRSSALLFVALFLALLVIQRRRPEHT